VTTRVVNLRREEYDVLIDRRTKWGNPFRVDGDWIAWAAIALGYRADKEGRRAASIAFYRAWMTGQPPQRGPWVGDQSELEFTDGTTVTMQRHVEGIAALAANVIYGPLEVPERPSIEPLRGKTLGCWCKPLPCHGDVIVELLA
jgi:hypothetical protein